MKGRKVPDADAIICLALSTTIEQNVEACLSGSTSETGVFLN